MHVERYGSGPVRYLGLHGWSGDHRTFAPLLPHLPLEVSFFAPDLPGCGRSPAPAGWRLEAAVEEIAALIRDLADPRVTLVGNCSGGLLGLCAVRALRDSGAVGVVERIFVLDLLAYWPWYFRVFQSRTMGKYAYACAFENPAGRWLVNACLAGKRRAETNLTEGFDAVPSEVTRGYLKMLGEIEGPEHFSGIETPITVLHGEKTFEAVRRSAKIYRRIWPQAEVRVVTGAGHLPLLEAPAEVAKWMSWREPCKAV